jgi:hypothetical protein
MTNPDELPGPVYPSWAAAMADPTLDLSRPWFVAPEGSEPMNYGPATPDWTGWQVLDSTES